MKKLLLMTCAAAAALCANAYTYFYWRGPANNPIWDTATANWSVSDSGPASTTFHNNNNDTIVKLDGQGAADVTVDAGGVSALVVEGRGSHAFYGGLISATYIDPYSGNLTICNTVNIGSLRLMTGQITVGDGVKDGALFKSTNLPSDWTVRYYASSHELKIVPQRGLVIRVN